MHVFISSERSEVKKVESRDFETAVGKTLHTANFKTENYTNKWTPVSTNSVRSLQYKGRQVISF